MTDKDPPYNPFTWYFQIDTEWIKKYQEQINKLSEELWDLPLLPKNVTPVELPVNGYFSNTAEDKTSLYLGNNCYNEGIWKLKYFVYNKLQKEYELHLQSHAGYVVSLPRYYQGLHEILN
jgi:hypothetical protein